MATDSLCTDLILSETELMRDTLAYFHFRDNLGAAWSTTSPKAVAGIITPPAMITTGTVLQMLWYRVSPLKNTKRVSEAL